MLALVYAVVMLGALQALGAVIQDAKRTESVLRQVFKSFLQLSRSR